MVTKEENVCSKRCCTVCFTCFRPCFSPKCFCTHIFTIDAERYKECAAVPKTRSGMLLNHAGLDFAIEKFHKIVARSHWEVLLETLDGYQHWIEVVQFFLKNVAVGWSIYGVRKYSAFIPLCQWEYLTQFYIHVEISAPRTSCRPS